MVLEPLYLMTYLKIHLLPLFALPIAFHDQLLRGDPAWIRSFTLLIGAVRIYRIFNPESDQK
jgi:hypothetical protein